MMVKLDEIVFEPLIYPRRINDKTQEPFYIHVRRYARAMRAGEKFPAIVLAIIKGKKLLVDGYHRMLAAKSLDHSAIAAEMIECKNLDEAFVEAVKRNNHHGAPLDDYEIALAVDKLQKANYSQAEISQIVSMPPLELKKMTDERIVKTSSGTLVLKRMFIGKNLPTNLNEESQKPYSSKSQVMLLKQVNQLLEDDLIDIDSEEVVAEIQKLKQLLRKLTLSS